MKLHVFAHAHTSGTSPWCRGIRPAASCRRSVRAPPWRWRVWRSSAGWYVQSLPSWRRSSTDSGLRTWGVNVYIHVLNKQLLTVVRPKKKVRWGNHLKIFKGGVGSDFTSPIFLVFTSVRPTIRHKIEKPPTTFYHIVDYRWLGWGVYNRTRTT